MLERTRIVLGSAVTWLVAAASVLTILIEELDSIAGLPPTVVRVLAVMLVVVLAALRIIRRVTPVLPSARGILPLEPGQPATAAEAELAHQLRTVRNEFP